MSSFGLEFTTFISYNYYFNINLIYYVFQLKFLEINMVQKIVMIKLINLKKKTKKFNI